MPAARKRLEDRQKAYDKRRGEHDSAVEKCRGTIARQEKDVVAYCTAKAANDKAGTDLKEGRGALRKRKGTLLVERGELKRKSKDFEDRLTGLNARKETHKGHWGVARGQVEQQLRNWMRRSRRWGPTATHLRGARDQMRKALDDPRKAEEERQRRERGLVGGR